VTSSSNLVFSSKTRSNLV